MITLFSAFLATNLALAGQSGIDIEGVSCRTPAVATFAFADFEFDSDALSAAGKTCETPQRSCFQVHLKEAIALNKVRRKLYAELTDGKSEPIFKELLRGERMALPLAWALDVRAGKYRKAGISLLCDEFEPICKTPEFRPFVPPAQPSPDPMPKIDAKAMQRRLESVLRTSGFEALEMAADHEIRALGNTPNHFCMLRHFLESVRRAARHAPRHAAAAESAGMKSSAGVSRSFVNAHLKNLDRSLKLDEKAYPIQAQGIPILCQDVPHIP